MLAQALAAVAFERQAGGVHEHHREIGKQITTALEQPLFDHILDATRRRGRPGGLLDGLAEPRHRAVKMMQTESLRAADVIVGHPRHAVPVGARDEQPVQGRHKHGALDGKAELARRQQAIQHLADAELLPQPREQQRTADPPGIERQAAVILIERLQQQHLVGELGARGEQCGQRTRRDQRLGTAEIGNHRLAHGAANAAALDNLNVGARARLLNPKEHRSPPMRSTTISSFLAQQQAGNCALRGTTYWQSRSPASMISITCQRIRPLNCSTRVRPVWRLMRDELLRSAKLFVDETTAPVLDPGRGRTKRGYFWVLARDDRPWCGRSPPAVVYSYAPGRGGDHAAALLQGYSGVLQTDGYAAYRSLADPKRVGGPVTLAFCWAHWRRQWLDLAKSPPAPIATEALKRIAELYQIEAEIRGK